MTDRNNPILLGLVGLVGAFALLLTIVTVYTVLSGLGSSGAESEEPIASTATESAVIAQPPTESLGAAAISGQSPTLTPTKIVPTITVAPTDVVSTAQAVAHTGSIVATTGQGLFEARCAPCHGLSGEGNIGPAFDDRLVLPLSFVLNRVRSGPAVMSAFTPEELPDEQIALIVDYLDSRIVGSAVPDFTEDDIAQGRELYREFCNECHGVRGLGKQDVGPTINIWPPMGISRIVDGGLLPLPGMPRLPITPDELVLVAAYIQSQAQGQ